MAEARLKLTIFILSWIFSFTSGQFRGNYPAPTSVNDTGNSNADISQCSCDLTKNSCDISCCCDTDCPAATLTLWRSEANRFCNSLVYEELQPLTRCINRNYVFRTNKRMGITIDDNDSKDDICVTLDDDDNSATYFDEITLDSTEDAPTIFNRWFDWEDTSDDPQEYTIDDTTVLYNKDDSVLRFDTNQNQQEDFNIPSLGAFGNWEFESNATFGRDSEFKCKYKMTDITTECQTYFNPSYYANLNIWRDGKCATNVAVNNLNGTAADPGADCSNRLKNLQLIFMFQEPDGSGFLINGVDLSYELETGTLANGDIAELTVIIKYYSNDSNVTEKSGNPGYISGERLLLRKDSATTYGYRKEISDSSDGTCLTVANAPTSTIYTDYLKFGEVANFQCTKEYSDTAAIQGECDNTTYK